MKSLRTLFALAALICVLSLSLGFAQDKPKTVIHIINVKWKADATPAQIQAALDAAHALPKAYPGIKRVWTKNIKYQAQEGFKQAIVMEFESEAALQKYADSPAQKAWYEKYLPIREASRTHDVTN
jgi:antibiotic biosynthesis monooxygenase (ABM) superfamily enzyme